MNVQSKISTTYFKSHNLHFGIIKNIFNEIRISKINIFLQIACIFLYLFSFSLITHIVNLLNIKNYDETFIVAHIIPAYCIIALVVILSEPHKKYVFYILYLICIFFGIIHAGHAILYGSEINAESAIAVIVTNGDESIEFIRSFSSYNLLIVLSLYMYLQFYLTKKIIVKLTEFKMNGREKMRVSGILCKRQC